MSIRHSVCRWCYDTIPLEDLCLAAREMGIDSIDLVMPEDMEVLARHGLTSAMISFPTGQTPDGTKVGQIEKAFNRLEYHETLVRIYEPHLRAAATAGAKQVSSKLCHGSPSFVAARGGARTDTLHGTSQQQGGPSRLSMRPQRMGSGAV